MVKTKREYVLASAFLSGIAVGLCLVSLGTTQWVVAEGKFTNYTNETNEIDYGLFSGIYLQRLGAEQRFILYRNEITTCLISENVCAYLCAPSSEARKAEIEILFKNEKPTFTCSPIKTKAVRELEPEVHSTYSLTDVSKNDFADINDKFINAGLYISTIVFLALSVIFGFIAAVLAVWNTAGNPIEVVFSIYGIYVYNFIACISSMIAIILWGALFGSHIKNNVSFSHTITGDMTTSGTANLGFSYWLMLPSMVLYAAALIVLILRQHLINQEPVMNIHTKPLDDGGPINIIF
ncbi:hypothetical protein FQR65_LT08136 [Abscondita terminalis]|nr:hypothetical protein FQR65_LT08136 [Abscondita terminalis]